MNKKLIAIIICLVMLFASSVFAADSGIKVTIDGKEMAFTDDLGYPMEYNDRIMIPFRQVFGVFGWTPTYMEDTETVMAISGNRFMAMQIGSKDYHVDGKKIPFDTAPMIVNDRTLVPIRLVAEAMGYGVDWDDANKAVKVTTTK